MPAATVDTDRAADAAATEQAGGVERTL